jgi:hypothetical protein
LIFAAQSLIAVIKQQQLLLPATGGLTLQQAPAELSMCAVSQQHH